MKKPPMQAMDLTPRCYIWITAIFLFTSVLSGGTFLVLYMTQPQSPATSWYPIVGITLVCLPWFFWVITVLYRTISRSLGFRMVCWGKSMLPANSMRNRDDAASEAASSCHDGLENGNTSNAAPISSSKEDASKGVHFGDSAAQSENNHNNLGSGGSNSSGASHESELPLKTSMV